MVTGDSEPTSKAQLVRQALNVGKGKAGEIDWKAMYEQIEKMKAKSPSSEPASVMHSVYSDSATTVNYDTASEPKDAEEVFIGGLPATHSAFTSADDVSYFEEETVAKDVELGASTGEEEEDFFSYNDPSARDRLSVITILFSSFTNLEQRGRTSLSRLHNWRWNLSHLAKEDLAQFIERYGAAHG